MHKQVCNTHTISMHASFQQKLGLVPLLCRISLVAKIKRTLCGSSVETYRMLAVYMLQGRHQNYTPLAALEVLLTILPVHIVVAAFRLREAEHTSVLFTIFA